MSSAYSHNSGDTPGQLELPASSETDATSPALTSLRDAKLLGDGSGLLAYPPSWVDRLTDRVRRLSVSPWLVYVAVGAVLTSIYLVLILLSAQWASGEIQLGTAILYSFL